MLQTRLEQVLSEFKCGICLSTMSIPVYLNHCKHSFCKDCANQTIRYKEECPICKVVTRRRDVAKSNQLMRLINGLKSAFAFAEKEFGVGQPASTPVSLNWKSTETPAAAPKAAAGRESRRRCQRSIELAGTLRTLEAAQPQKPVSSSSSSAAATAASAAASSSSNPTRTSRTKDAAKSRSSTLKKGDRVEVKYGGVRGRKFYPGMITRVRTAGVDTRYDILYDDGDQETDVRRSYIKWLADQRKPLPKGYVYLHPDNATVASAASTGAEIDLARMAGPDVTVTESNATSFDHEIACCDVQHVGVWRGKWEVCRVERTYSDNYVDVTCRSDGKDVRRVPTRFIREKRVGGKDNTGKGKGKGKRKSSGRKRKGAAAKGGRKAKPQRNVARTSAHYMGCRIRLRVDESQQLSGIVVQFNPSEQRLQYHVQYDDGNCEWVQLPDPTGDITILGRDDKGKENVVKPARSCSSLPPPASPPPSSSASSSSSSSQEPPSSSSSTSSFGSALSANPIAAAPLRASAKQMCPLQTVQTAAALPTPAKKSQKPRKCLPPRGKIVFLPSHLSKKELVSLRSLASLVGAEMASTYSAEVTHIIAKTVETPVIRNRNYHNSSKGCAWPKRAQQPQPQPQPQQQPPPQQQQQQQTHPQQSHSQLPEGVKNRKPLRLARRRTEKYLLGILGHKMIVSHDWIGACLERKALESAEEFLVDGDGIWRGCMKQAWRTKAIEMERRVWAGGEATASPNLNEAQEQPRKIFSGYRLFFLGEFRSPNPSIEVLLGLAQLGGAEIAWSAAHLVPDQAGDAVGVVGGAGGGCGGGRAQQELQAVVVCDSAQAAGHMPKELKVQAGKGQVLVVGHKWVMDSISNYSVVDPLAYLLKGRGRVFR